MCAALKTFDIVILHGRALDVIELQLEDAVRRRHLDRDAIVLVVELVLIDVVLLVGHVGSSGGDAPELHGSLRDVEAQLRDLGTEFAPVARREVVGEDRLGTDGSVARARAMGRRRRTRPGTRGSSGH